MLSIINAVILMAIAAIHFYWAFGGKRATKGVFPEIKTEKPLVPGTLATLVVAFILLLFATIYLQKTGLMAMPYPSFISKYGTLALAGVFIVRAIGEFKYIGFFKTERNSLFADLDTKYYTPLCLFLGINSLIISFL